MTSELAQDTLKKHVIQKFPTPELAPEGGIWTCPFCQAIDPKVIPYLLETPAFSNEIQEKKIKKIITDHLEEHQSFLYQMLIDQQRDGAYEKNHKEKSKRVRLWIEGTVKDRGLYEKDPF